MDDDYVRDDFQNGRFRAFGRLANSYDSFRDEEKNKIVHYTGLK